MGDISSFERGRGVNGMLRSLLRALLDAAADRGIITGVSLPAETGGTTYDEVWSALQRFIKRLPTDRPHFILMDEVRFWHTQIVELERCGKAC